MEKFCSGVLEWPLSLIPNFSSGLANVMCVPFHSTPTPLGVDQSTVRCQGRRCATASGPWHALRLATVRGSPLTYRPLDRMVKIDPGTVIQLGCPPATAWLGPRCRGGRSVAAVRQYDAPLRDRRPEHRIRRVTLSL